MKRQLTEVEKLLSRNNIKLIEEDIEYGNAMLEYYDLQLNKLMPLNYNRKIREFNNNVKQIKNEIEVGKNIIKETEKQIREGVEVKSEKDKAEEDSNK